MKKISECCKHKKKDLKCIRKADNKKFKLPRKFSKEKCINTNIKGFSMKSSCAPYKNCKPKKQFLYNPEDPKKSFDVYIDKNPNDTIPIKYKTITDVKNTIRKLEKLYKQKKYTHKRIWQVGMIMKVRLEVIKKKYPNANQIKSRFNLSNRYFKFLGNRTKLSDKARYKSKFNF